MYGNVEKKTLIVCALEVETQGKLEDYDVLYTGVGKVNATYKLTNILTVLGSLKDNYMWRLLRAAKQNHMLD